MTRLGFGELGLVFGVALLIFGPGRLPAMGKAIGETVSAIRKASAKGLAENGSDDANDAE